MSKITTTNQGKRHREIQRCQGKFEKFRQKIIELEQENLWIDWLSQHQEKFLYWDSFSRERLQDALNKFVERILVRFDEGKNEHTITIKFKLPV